MDAATAAVLALAAGTFVAACLANVFAYRTFREARNATAAQLNTLAEQQLATSLGRQAVQEAQRATEIATHARREEQISRQVERLVHVSECVASLGVAVADLRPSLQCVEAVNIAVRQLGVAISALTLADLPQCASLTRIPHLTFDGQHLPETVSQHVVDMALMEATASIGERRKELEALQHADE